MHLLDVLQWRTEYHTLTAFCQRERPSDEQQKNAFETCTNIHYFKPLYSVQSTIAVLCPDLVYTDDSATIWFRIRLHKKRAVFGSLGNLVFESRVVIRWPVTVFTVYVPFTSTCCCTSVRYKPECLIGSISSQALTRWSGARKIDPAQYA